MATGCTFVSLSLHFARGETTVGTIVHETTKIIWDTLNEIYMPVPTREHWKLIADRFESIWNLPNCIGALDGKHVRIEKFPNTGSQNFNYKSYHSVVLMACCDADGLFTMIESGYAGRNSDGGIFKASAMKYWITHGGFDIPSPSPLTYDETNSPFPYYFAADEAFPLSQFLLRPYSKRTLDNVKRIFNYRLSRGRKTIECAFGMAAEKFQVLNGPIRCRKLESVNDIIKAVCILHNYVRKREGIVYRPTDTQDDHEMAAVGIDTIIPRQITINERSSANTIRNYLSNYFLSPRASLPWQWKYTVPEIRNTIRYDTTT